MTSILFDLRLRTLLASAARVESARTAAIDAVVAKAEREILMADRLAEAIRVFCCTPELKKMTRLRATDGYRALRVARDEWLDARAALPAPGAPKGGSDV